MRGLAVALLLLVATAAAAQDVTLEADRVDVRANGDVIIAEGNVTVSYDSQTLEARRITYDRRADRILAEGPLRLRSAEGVVLLASLAEVSADLRNGLIEGARLILNEELQIAATGGERIDGRYNGLDRVVATSCVVCAIRPVPLWRIRAARVIHDEEAERIWFRNAFFDVLGVPVAYTPALRIPAPGVRRATGALVPQASRSGIYGYGLKLPYYITLGDHADATLTPFITTDAGTLLEGEYRQNFQAGALRAAGAFLIDPDEEGGLRGFLDAEAAFALPASFRLDAEFNTVTDSEFLQEFNFSDRDRLTSFVSINRVRSREYVDARIVSYQSLRDDEPEDEIPLVLPRIDYRQSWIAGPAGGRLTLEADALSLVRADGRDVFRIGSGLGWRGAETLPFGVQGAVIGDVRGDAYVTTDADEDRDVATRFVPSAGVELRWPLVRGGPRGETHVIEPVAQLIASTEIENGEIVNEDSLLPELDETSLFLFNRFPGRDAIETGARANLGFTYSRYDPSGWSVSVTGGQILREEAGDRFTLASGLSGVTSDFVAAVNFDLPPALELTGRSLFAPDDFAFRRGEVEIGYRAPRFDASSRYLFLAEDLDLDLPERQEATVGGRFRFAPNWEVSGQLRYDFVSGLALDREAVLRYGNECAEIELSVSRKVTTSNNVPTSTNIGLTVNLAGLGGTRSRDWPTGRCDLRS